jgi:hypothetical protein
MLKEKVKFLMFKSPPNITALTVVRAVDKKM